MPSTTSTNIVKFLFLIYLFLYAASGCCALGYVIYVLYHVHTFDNMINKSPIYHLLGPLSFLQITAYVGWKAVKNHHVCTLKTFAGLTVFTIAWEMGGGVWCLVDKSHFPEIAPKLMKESFSTAYNSELKTSRPWDSIHKELKCCGVNGPSDFKGDNRVPFSCCASNPEQPGESSCVYIYQKGCLEGFFDEVKRLLNTLALLSIGLGLFQVPGIFGSCCLANRIALEYDEVPSSTTDHSIRPNRAIRLEAN